ncbi:MAG: DNA polymerase III subunit gamma/tau [Selenomonadaceae bacterium]|nr:DNA polymerase III subunit gamma/tau [Selenomonadaceae bacterium]
MAYIALYRKWRPQTFRDLVGQEPISRTLSNAITSGRIGHAFLFSGPRGTGKTSTAKIFARALNCEHGPTPEPCGKCESCQKITKGSSLDVYEIDAASNRGIDEIRGLRETVKFAPAESRYKVYIIDEVHMLTAEAFNALLKTLEEPPEHVVFILATTEIHKVPATIQSRCQRFDFHRIAVEEIEGRLREIAKQSDMEIEDEALAMIAIQADGGLRDALSILDQCSALSDGKITAARVRQILGLVGHDWIYQMTDAIAAHEAQKLLEMVAKLLQDGKDMKQMLAELSLHFRSIMIYQAAGTLNHMDLYDEREDVLKRQSTAFSPDAVMLVIARLHEAMNELKWSPQPRVTVEVALLALAHGDWGAEKPEPAALVQGSGDGNDADAMRIAQLEAKIAKLSAMLERGAAAGPAVLPAGNRKTVRHAGKEHGAPETHAVEATAPAKGTQDPTADTKTPASEEGKALFDRLMQTVQTKNAPLFACLHNAAFAGMNADHFVLNFHRDLSASLADKIYKKQIERILAELHGAPLALICRCDDRRGPLGQPKKEKPVPKQPAPPDPQEQLKGISAEERSQLEKAKAVFGDHIVAVKDVEEEKSE